MPTRAARDAAEDVAAADDQRQLAARRVDLAQLGGEAGQHVLVDAVAGLHPASASPLSFRRTRR